MIPTLVFTIIIESLVIFGYAQWRKKPIVPLLLSALFANLLTQTLLWLALTALPTPYLPTLLVAELLIAGIEACILFIYKRNDLRLKEAVLLSFLMNAASFGIGWFLKM